MVLVPCFGRTTGSLVALSKACRQTFGLPSHRGSDAPPLWRMLSVLDLMAYTGSQMLCKLRQFRFSSSISLSGTSCVTSGSRRIPTSLSRSGHPMASTLQVPPTPRSSLVASMSSEPAKFGRTICLSNASFLSGWFCLVCCNLGLCLLVSCNFWQKVLGN